MIIKVGGKKKKKIVNNNYGKSKKIKIASQVVILQGRQECRVCVIVVVRSTFFGHLCCGLLRSYVVFCCMVPKGRTKATVGELYVLVRACARVVTALQCRASVSRERKT